MKKRWKSSIDYPSFTKFQQKLPQSPINNDELMKTLHRFTHRSLYQHRIHKGLCNDVNTMEIPHRLHIAPNTDMKLKLLMQNKYTCKSNARENNRTEYALTHQINTKSLNSCNPKFKYMHLRPPMKTR